MSKINRKVNVKTLVALKRVYSAQLELYEYILSHEVPFGDTEDTFMRRTLSDLADASEKILAHINLNTYHETMYIHVRVAFGSVQNSLSVFDRLLQLVDENNCSLSLGLSDKFVVFKEKLETAMSEAKKTANILKTRLAEGF